MTTDEKRAYDKYKASELRTAMRHTLKCAMPAGVPVNKEDLESGVDCLLMHLEEAARGVADNLALAQRSRDYGQHSRPVVPVRHSYDLGYPKPRQG